MCLRTLKETDVGLPLFTLIKICYQRVLITLLILNTIIVNEVGTAYYLVNKVGDTLVYDIIDYFTTLVVNF